MTTHGTVARLRPFGGTIFAEMSELAVRHGAVNLGQGFPDWDGPPRMLEVARGQIAAGNNQYPPGRGMPGLRAAIADDRAARYGSVLDPATEVLVTVGATEAIAAAVLGLVEPGREVILIEPYYDSYAAAVALAGARRVAVPLVRDGRGFALDVDALRAAVTRDTAMIVVNTPHNPTGTMLTADELGAVAEIACEHDLIVLSDEVYEHLTFDAGHVPVASLPGMRERTITVSSAAKAFNVTGWKIGWALAPAPLIDGVLAAKQFLTFVGGAPFQPAVEHALRHEQAWVEGLRRDLLGKRDRLSAALRNAGFDTLTSAGTYYVCVDLGDGVDGLDFCRRLPAERGVAGVPVSVFTDHPGPWRGIVRFAFCKRDEVLDEGVRRLLAANS
ncbi:pyridoxal phosphate-dependent aminotransferase [Tessaracoccus lacteus]|uniref:Pyridoxal phosphate-dependent aminotransferase n=1 Tax=Tessaracoccus lacteus TaxID=3041766 RepID=A0ABY8PYJ6_9ACTN|nr:pyridoxal phosphate-dependent aminotransferase [Tessaracoccus sp. T21]WGT47578.1 pyridoxal phosphate-dependent aminotransferase [Tessaracoccus sp. T21]